MTTAQKGLREFHINAFTPKSKKKKEQVSNFSKFHAKEDEEEDDEAANARLNRLVSALKNEHDRTKKSRVRYKDKKHRSNKAHKSVKPIAGLPTSTALPGAED